MTRDDITALASQVGAFFDVYGFGRTDGVLFTPNELERFSALVVAAEREACAKVCEARYMGDNNREDMEARRCSAAIRARSST